MEKYAIWKNQAVIGYVELTQEQRDKINGIEDAGIYIGFDKITNPELYPDLENTIKEDCKHWEKLNGNGFYHYLHLQECIGSKESGIYQLILNGKELWYGTLAEINAVVKTMIMRIERDF